MQTKVLLHNVGVPDSHQIETYIGQGGYSTLERVLKELQPAQVVEIVSNSGLRGRGGAGFPTGRKWMFLPKGVYPRYLVCNADEGEPGTFKDRVLMEHDPHGVIEGIVISRPSNPASARSSRETAGSPSAPRIRLASVMPSWQADR